MGGGLMQLVSYGAQDVYISGNPQITFWKILYKRHTNFAVESIEVTFNGQADFNKSVTAVINRNADLMYKTYVQVVLPQVTPVAGTARWVNYIGHQLIQQVEVEIGGQRIDRQYGDWMQIWTQLATDAGSVEALNSMIGHTPQLVLPTQAEGYPVPQPCSSAQNPNSCAPLRQLPATTLYIPLQFWFCRNPGVAIPLIALQYHEVRVNVQFQQAASCAWLNPLLTTSTSATPGSFLAYGSLLAASLWVDYCYLDTEERRRFAQQSHEYLIEQVQYTGAESITSSSNKIQLNFNHPVKELFWVVQRDSYVDCSSGSVVNTTLFGPQPFNYSDDFDSSIWALSAGANDIDNNFLQGTRQATSLTYAGTGLPVTAGGLATVGSVETLLPFLLSKVILQSGVRCEGQNPVEVAKIQLNGQDRFTEREGSYFDKVQPYQHHSRTPSTGINCYSFALRPEEHQPSGTCNFSRIDKATLQLTVSVGTVGNLNTAQVRVYALNYNVLRVMSGMGGLAYSN
jgi:hypothetical protein